MGQRPTEQRLQQSEGPVKTQGTERKDKAHLPLRPFKMSGGEETRGRGVISAAPRGPQPAGLLKGVEGKGLGTEPMEKVEQMGESLGWGRSPDSWDSGEGNIFKGTCSQDHSSTWPTEHAQNKVACLHPLSPSESHTSHLRKITSLPAMGLCSLDTV